MYKLTKAGVELRRREGDKSTFIMNMGGQWV
jgi:hypothetical protein